MNERLERLLRLRETRYPVGQKVILRDGQVATVTEWLERTNGEPAIRLSGIDRIYYWAEEGQPKSAEGPHDIVGLVRPMAEPCKRLQFDQVTTWAVTEEDEVIEVMRFDRYLKGFIRGVRRAWYLTGKACSRVVAKIIGWIEWVADPPVFAT